MDEKEYILELLKNGLWVFPVRGKGKTVDEAKRPMSFKEGDEVVTWKDERILAYSEELARKGHRAWAIWLFKSRRFGIDIDLYKSSIDNKDVARGKLVEEFSKYNRIYSEVSAKGGIHIITFVMEPDVKYKLLSNVSWIEYKHDGYFIIYPTCLKVPGKTLCYKRITGNILDTLETGMAIMVIRHALRHTLRLYDLEMDVVEAREAGRKIQLPSGRVEGLGIEDVDRLTDTQITALLYLLFLEADCEGMARAMESIDESGVVPIRKRMYNVMQIPRTTRWLFQFSVASVMAYLGFSSDRVYDYLMSWRFIDEDTDPREDSPHNVLYNIFHYRVADLMPRGGCPWCWLLARREGCADTPFRRVLRIPRDRVIRILEFIKRNIS